MNTIKHILGLFALAGTMLLGFVVMTPILLCAGWPFVVILMFIYAFS